jgi:hypothetical protein
MEMTTEYILEFNSKCGLSISRKYLNVDVDELEIPDELKKDIDCWLTGVRCLRDFEYAVNNENLTRLADLQGKYLAKELFWNLICSQNIKKENCGNEYRSKYYYRNIFNNELVWVLDWEDDEEINTFSGRCSLLY